MLNSKSSISCKIVGSEYFGYLKWEYGDSRFAYLKDLPRHAEFNLGDTVVTSGYSTVFPAGVMVGTVDDMSDSHDGLSYLLKIKLATDFGKVSNVRVIARTGQEEQKVLETTNAFLRKDLSLSILSRETGIYQKLLSRSINEYLKQNFFELINEMRVGEAKRRLLLPENAGHTVDSLYEECGFRTRSTFFLAFKKVEGLSPAQWLNSVKKHTDQ